MATAAAKVAAGQQGKKVPGRPFSKGGDPRQAHEIERVTDAALGRIDPEPCGSSVLAAYRAVLLNLKKFDRGGLEKQARKLMDGDNKAFMDRVTALEREESARLLGAVLPEQKAEKLAEDHSEDRVLELAGALLRELSDGEPGAKENPVGGRSGAGRGAGGDGSAGIAGESGV